MGLKLELNIPEELKEDLSRYFSGVDWSKVASKVARQELEKLVRLKRIVEKSQLTEGEAKELAKEVDKALAKRFRESK